MRLLVVGQTFAASWLRRSRWPWRTGAKVNHVETIADQATQSSCGRGQGADLLMVDYRAGHSPH